MERLERFGPKATAMHISAWLDVAQTCSKALTFAQPNEQIRMSQFSTCSVCGQSQPVYLLTKYTVHRHFAAWVTETQFVMYVM